MEVFHPDDDIEEIVAVPDLPNLDEGKSVAISIDPIISSLSLVSYRQEKRFVSITRERFHVRRV